MRQTGFITERLIAIFFLGLGLFSYPIITIFNVKKMLFGIPLLYFYVFIVWLSIILLVFTFSGGRKKHQKKDVSDSILIPPSP